MRSRARSFLLLLLVLSVGLAGGCVRISSSTPADLPTLVPTAVPVPSATSLPAGLARTPPLPTATAVQSGAEPSDPPLSQPTSSPTAQPTIVPTSPPTAAPTLPPQATPTAELGVGEIIGKSSGGRPLISYRFGAGPDHIVFIGGMHGGYEWNTILLAYQAIDYFTDTLGAVPDSVTLHIVPSANPDGQALVTGKEGRFSAEDVRPDSFPGRFNANNVDLNRNWDCNWQRTAYWRDQPIDPGAAPFSEPENQALRAFFMRLKPIAVVFWHSAANGVYAAGCPELYQPSFELATIYGRAANYPVYPTFDLYQVTGDAGDWLALQNVPSISVELVNHQATEWHKNLEGMLAVLTQYQQIDRK